MIDSHVHLLNFVQDGPGAPALLSGMDDAGVDRAVVFGLPVKKRWATTEPRRPGYYLDDNAGCYYYSLTDALVADEMRALGANDRSRLAPTLCGFDPTDQLAIEQVERLWASDVEWAGIGELLLRHDDLTNLTQGEPATINHPALDPVLDFARQRDVPVMIHQDSSAPGRAMEHEYVPELATVLARHEHTTVVWSHAGISRRIAPDKQAQLVAGLLHDHPGLHIDLSWVLGDRIVPDGHPLDGWVELVGRFPERFVLGSDSVARPQDIGPALARFDALLGALDRGVADLVRTGNAERLWFRR